MLLAKGLVNHFWNMFICFFSPEWAQQHTHQSHELFTRCVCARVCVCMRYESEYNDKWEFEVWVYSTCVHTYQNRSTEVCVCVSLSVFHRDILLQVLSRSQLVVCYKAKDFLCTALQFYKRDLSWKQGSAHIHKYTYTRRNVHWKVASKSL